VQLLLVRHAQPEVSPALESPRWPLSAAGRRAAQGLAFRLPRGEKLWLSSEELKAVQTFQCLTDSHQEAILRDARFNEIHRHEPFDDDFRSRRRAWVEGNMDARHTGWETPQEAASRFDEAISAYAGRADRLVICSHGMVITAWLVHRGRVQAGSGAGAFWAALAFPDVVDVELD